MKLTTKQERTELAWQNIKDRAPEELYLALRNFASGYDGTLICEWLANLWDPETGGFYYSNSARDNDGFLPDIESTNQALAFLQCNKAFADPNKFLPNEIKKRIVNFTLNLQSEKDGYFYHPQWPQGRENLRSDRYGRDLGSATSIIRKFTVDFDGDGVEEKVYPKLCTPSGLKCKKHAGTDEVCDCLKVEYKPPVKQTAPSEGIWAIQPDMSTPETFRTWLELVNKDIKTVPHMSAHIVNCQSSEIFNRGYAPIVIDFLEKIQDEVYREQVANGETPSGFWSYKASFSLAMSMHKYFAFINDPKWGRPLKYHMEAAATAIDNLMLDAEGKKGLNDLMNQWISFGHIIRNVQKHYPDDLEKIYGMARARGAELVKNAEHNLDAHRLDNGLFAYYLGKSFTPLYGTPVSMGVPEGDVNGHLLMGHYYNSIFDAFGFPHVPLCDESDGERFRDILIEKLEKSNQK
jgi:hypothetical protein